jgi:type II restriction enzyme
MNKDIVNQFKKRFINMGIKLILPDKSVTSFRDDKRIFVLSVQNKYGIINDERKIKLISLIRNFNSRKYFITLFNNRKELYQCSDRLGWDTYAWFSSEPEHVIHFDEAQDNINMENNIGFI